jgi:hypothetical protein
MSLIGPKCGPSCACKGCRSTSPYGRIQRAGRAAGVRSEPEPKFGYDDIVSWETGFGSVSSSASLGRARGKISFIGSYDDVIKGYRYKVLEPDGTRLYHNEGSLRLVRRATR